MIMTPSTKKNLLQQSIKRAQQSIEPIDNSVDGKGYYYFGNGLTNQLLKI